MFKGNTSRDVTALEYIPPAGVDPQNMAATVDVMVLPEGQLEASGRPVISFTLPQSTETRTFAIPGRAEGKGLWLRVAAAPGQEKSYVGDFRILSEQRRALSPRGPHGEDPRRDDDHGADHRRQPRHFRKEQDSPTAAPRSCRCIRTPSRDWHWPAGRHG